MMGIIYFIQADDQSLFKIGKCEDRKKLERRLFSIQLDIKQKSSDIIYYGMLDAKLSIYEHREVKDHSRAEKDIHNFLWQRHVRIFRSVEDREWFNINDDEVKEILSGCFLNKKFRQAGFQKTKLYASFLEKEIDRDIGIYNEFEDNILMMSIHLNKLLDKIERFKSLGFEISADRFEKYKAVANEAEEIRGLASMAIMKKQDRKQKVKNATWRQ